MSDPSQDGKKIHLTVKRNHILTTVSSYSKNINTNSMFDVLYQLQFRTWLSVFGK